MRVEHQPEPKVGRHPNRGRPVALLLILTAVAVIGVSVFRDATCEEKFMTSVIDYGGTGTPQGAPWKVAILQSVDQTRFYEQHRDVTPGDVAAAIPPEPEGRSTLLNLDFEGMPTFRLGYTGQGWILHGTERRYGCPDRSETWMPIGIAVAGGLAFAAVIWWSAWYVVAALVGAVIGAFAFRPIEYRILDGYADCEACGYYVETAIGMTFKEPWIDPMAIGALVGAILGLIAWGLTRAIRTRRRLTSTTGVGRPA